MTKPETRHHTLNGKTRHLREWAELHGIPYSTLSNRIYRGESLEVALDRPMQRHGKKMITAKQYQPRRKLKTEEFARGPVVNGKYWDGYKYVVI